MPTREFLIRGKVQGVFYRATAQKKAKEWGLTGWVKNREDGSVQLVASGPSDDLDRLAHWCRIGPEGAGVTEVMVREMAEQAFSGFQIVR